MCRYSSSAIVYYVALPIPKELLRLSVEPSLGSDPPVRLNLHRKTNTGIRICIHMWYAGFEPAIQVSSENIFAVYYSHNTTAACHNLSTTILQHAANKSTAGRATSFPWFRLFTR